MSSNHTRAMSQRHRRLFVGGLWAALAMAAPLAAAEPQGISSEQQRVTIFGVQGQGSKFVYVLDRSGSMGDPDNKPLTAAKTELLASIGELKKEQQFYVITYNHEPRMLDIAGVAGRLQFASDANRDTAKRLIGAIKADGGTRHDLALSLALKARPDVIFLLTDGDAEDDLTKDDVTRLMKINFGGAVINVIQFSDPPKKHDNQLVRLAKESGGEHKYVDLLKFKRE